ncbi:MAG: glycosyl transferase [Desulfobulbaceae bacterium]|nr:MAG: glycosyl transferase [Desulfobulbaceae bacterium]
MSKNGARDNQPAASVGVVIIGRNEGKHLRRTFAALPEDKKTVVLYVDSGSTDGSVELAETMGVQVHKLDPSRPFSPARARGEGATRLIKQHPELACLQFVDGDCELVDGWLAAAMNHLAQHSEVAIVCGGLQEREPERSIYNWLSARQWALPPGMISNCGGIFMIRRSVYQNVGGFNEILVTLEEKDLCDRVLAAGHRIVRLDTAMARHDSGLHHFSQWWQRAVWGGFGAGVQWAQGGSESWLTLLRRYLFWPVVVPFAMVAALIGSFWAAWLIWPAVASLAAYGVLLARISKSRRRLGDSWQDALIYSFMIIVRKFPVAVGFLLYLLRRGDTSGCPDPHAAQEGNRSSIKKETGSQK